MCHYCGCRQIRLLRDYIAEHERVTELGDLAVRAIDARELDKARRCVDEMAVELTSHWQGEEDGLFTVMRREEAEYADYIDPLVSEHRELANFLARVDVASPADQARLRREVLDLLEHVSKEEDGLFPAALTTLSGPDWDEAIGAWHRAHPGQELIRD